jgi:glycosyltransferase involved in cell wall biosynthesis
VAFRLPARPLSISLIVSDLSSKGAGRWGGAIRPFLLAQSLKKLGHHVKLVGLAYEEDAASLPTHYQDIPIIAFPCPYYGGLYSTGLAIKRLLPHIKGDLFYAVKLKPSSFGLALLKKVFTGRPLLLDIDDWEMSWFGGDEWRYRPQFKEFAKDLLQPQGKLRHLDSPLYLQGIEKLASRADGITLHTHFMQKRFGGTYIPNGKDIEHFNPERYDPQVSRQKYGLENYKILMFPGAPRPYKGIEDVLTALDQLDRPDLRLVIVGGSPYDDYDRQLQRKWGRWIIQLPRAPVSSMPEIIAAAHVIVVPQRDSSVAKAQFPLKLTDGMAMAKPIIASRVGDIPEILENTGYLVDPSSPAQIAQCLKTIFQDYSQAMSRGLSARDRCIQHYSLENMSRILEQVLAAL